MVILIVIGVFSLPILFKQLEVPTPDLTVKATGNQWYWTYDYPENDVTFDSLMLAAGGARRPTAMRRTSTCSPPTTRWWCRWTRWCTCW